ncbi:MAG: hypothetical protein EXR79_16430 [Myxococcales bacterium]|nr:hypothetical protein [Myxococcales bacterium]
MDAIFIAILPGWHGRRLKRTFPRHVRLALKLSGAVADLVALVRHGRTFRLLQPSQREELLNRMAHHRWAWPRALVQWWKLVALVTWLPPEDSTDADRRLGA